MIFMQLYPLPKNTVKTDFYYESYFEFLSYRERKKKEKGKEEKEKV